MSALTYVGGHFYNRRWDRALLFFALLAFWNIAAYASMTFRLSEIGSETDANQMLDMMSLHWNMAAIGTLVLWSSSLVVTYLDTRQSTERFIDRWTVSGLVGAFGFSLLAGAVLLMQVSLFGVFDSIEHDQEENPASAARHDPSDFYHYVHLGSSQGSHDLAKAPHGDGYLTGRFVLDGKPAAGVRFRLALNGKYETEKLTSDANGEFEVRLPRGEWYVSRLVTHDWSEHPADGSYMLVTGEEPKITDGQYDQHYWMGRQGIKVAVGDRPKQPHLTFGIRKRVELRWPEAGDKPVATTVDSGVVAWEPYPNADTYLLRINEVTREGRTTSYRDVTSTLVKGATRFPLTRLQTLPNDDVAKEYQVTILAFDKDKKFLSESQERFRGHAFMLSDKKQFVREAERIIGSENFSAEELQQAHDNNRRIDATVVLLKDGLDKEAERLLAKIQGKVDPGKKAAVTGYLMAVRGRCTEANRLFMQAQSEAGQGCVPDYYRGACGKLAK